MRWFVSIAVLLAACFAPAASIGQDAATSTGAPTLAAAYNATGGKLMRALAARPGNIVFSPVSIGLVMSMAAHGARAAIDAWVVMGVVRGSSWVCRLPCCAPHQPSRAWGCNNQVAMIGQVSAA
jgi:hypothetical protein